MLSGNVESRVRLCVFDLDGVLSETKDFHFSALNLALNEVQPGIAISREEHLQRFDGLSTMTKLRILNTEKGLESSKFGEIWDRKQEITKELLQTQPPHPGVRKAVKELYQSGFKVAVASNSIMDTIVSEIDRLGISDFVEIVLSNEDVTLPKPHPEIYWRAMMQAGAHPGNTWILEDSSVGREAALSSGAILVPVDSPSRITTEFVREKIMDAPKKARKTPWHPPEINVLIPMAGAGSRFSEAGYSFPKPLIEVFGRTMIELVVKNLNIEGRFIFIVQRKHDEIYNLSKYLQMLKPDCEVVHVDGLTDGAARTALLAAELIDSDTPLLIANSDQYIEWDSNEVMYQFSAKDCDGGILTFESTHPKWSFARTDQNGWVTEVAEKVPISNIATTGIYYWAKGSDFVKFASEMIRKDIRHNGEFYICPVYNEAIADGRKIRARGVHKMWGLGTPEDLTTFLRDEVAERLVRSLS